MSNRARAATTYGTPDGRSSIHPPIPQQHMAGVPQWRVNELRAMQEDGTLVAYCEQVLDGVAGRMLELIDREVA